MRVCRGVISSEAQWHYNNNKDALIFINGGINPIILKGFGIVNCTSGATINYNVLKNEKTIESLEIIFEPNENNDRKTTEIHFTEEIKWNINEEIEIVLQQINNGSVQSKRVHRGNNFMEQDNDIKIRVKTSKKDTNSTTIEVGAFPYLIIDRMVNIPLNIFCQQSFVNLLNCKAVESTLNLASKTYQIDSNYLKPIENILLKYLDYTYLNNECKDCNKKVLELDQECPGLIFKNASCSWMTKKCNSNNCEDCFEKKTVFHLHKENDENIMDEDNIDLHNPGLFDEIGIDQYELSEIKSCSHCYEKNKEENDCKICHRVYSADSEHYQKCNSCELKRVCRLCMVEDFVANKCMFCNSD